MNNKECEKCDDTGHDKETEDFCMCYIGSQRLQEYFDQFPD